MENIPLEVDLNRSFLKHLLRKDIYIEDFADLDTEYFKHLNWILNNDVTDLDLFFTITTNYFGIEKVIELIPNGS